jgi:hypothetical protein
MAEKRTVTIETQANPTLSIQIRADLIEEFVSKVTDKHGPFRNKDESFDDALESAVEIAFTNFLKSGKRPVDWD